MDTVTNPIESRHNRGQTLAEFAITLPILLMLLFGIIEFGRLFQSWVTIENAARAAARYTITGQYDETRYNLDALVVCNITNPALIKDTYLAPLYTAPGFNLANFQAEVGMTTYNERYQYTAGVLYQKVIIWKDSGVVDNESLYRTWYGTDDCFPSDDSLTARKDILRLPSIYDVARIGAAGLSLEPSISNQRTGETPQQALQRFLFTSFSNPNPLIETPGWFNVVVCSARQRQYSSDFSGIFNNPDDPKAGTDEATLRYYTVLNANQDPDFIAGACINKEKLEDRPENANYLDHFEVAMMDAGGAGERVNIVVTYNHPLITPLGLAKFVRLQASRAAVNESFKVTNAERALGPGGPAGPPFLSPTPQPPTNTPTKTYTPLPTLTASQTPTGTASSTPSPFACNKITATPIAFVQNRVVVKFLNTNYQDTYLTGSIMYWDSARLTFDYPNASVRFLTFDTQIFWLGNDKVSPVDTRVAAIDPAPDNGNGVTYISPSQPFWLFASPNGDEHDPNTWEATFINGPQTLTGYFGGWEFAGTQFFFDNPSSATDCIVNLQVPNAPPTNTPAPANFTPSPTFTPNCASNLLKVQFVRFDPDGDLVLQVVNNRTVEGPFTGFSLPWPAYKASSLKLQKIVVGGVNGNNSDGTGAVVWNSLAGGGYRPSGVVIGNPSPATVTTSTDTAAGVWNDGGNANKIAYSFRANSTTLVFIDFTGIGTSSLETRGIVPSDFNGMKLFIGCGRTGSGGSGGGGGAAGEIILDNLNTPVPTLPPAPTNTPGPTPTPSLTKTPSPPTNTPSPAPPTMTPTKTPTKSASNTPAPSSTPTDAGFNPP